METSSNQPLIEVGPISLRIVADYNYPLVHMKIPGQKPAVVRGRTLRGYSEFSASIYQLLYLSEIREMEIFEIGGAVAEFIPELVKKRMKNPPAVIDPLDYISLEQALSQAIKDKRFRQYEQEFKTWLARIPIYTDESKVRLINMTLEQAIATYPGLRGTADRVVDIHGAMQWSNDAETARQMEMSLLKVRNPLHLITSV